MCGNRQPAQYSMVSEACIRRDPLFRLIQRVQELEAATMAQVSRQQTLVIGFAVVVGLVAIAIALIGPHLMSKAIRQVSARIREITDGDGDLTARIQSHRKDEIGELAEQFRADGQPVAASQRLCPRGSGASSRIAPSAASKLDTLAAVVRGWSSTPEMEAMPALLARAASSIASATASRSSHSVSRQPHAHRLRHNGGDVQPNQL